MPSSRYDVTADFLSLLWTRVRCTSCWKKSRAQKRYPLMFWASPCEMRFFTASPVCRSDSALPKVLTVLPTRVSAPSSPVL